MFTVWTKILGYLLACYHLFEILGVYKLRKKMYKLGVPGTGLRIWPCTNYSVLDKEYVFLTGPFTLGIKWLLKVWMSVEKKYITDFVSFGISGYTLDVIQMQIWLFKLKPIYIDSLILTPYIWLARSSG